MTKQLKQVPYVIEVTAPCGLVYNEVHTRLQWVEDLDPEPSHCDVEPDPPKAPAAPVRGVWIHGPKRR